MQVLDHGLAGGASAKDALADALAGVPGLEAVWTLPWRGHHLLLLTATPHMGKDYPWFAL